MSTTDKASKLKYSSSISSNDLISRLLAATPSYLYNVSPMQHNFFFSEMLRSLVQAKNNSVFSNNSNIRRCKKSWRYTHNQPLKLTTKSKNQNQTQISNSISSIQYDNQQYHQKQTNKKQEDELLRRCHHQYLKEHQFQNSLFEKKSRKYNHYTDNSQEITNQIYKQKIQYLTNNTTDYLLKNKELNNAFCERILSNSQNKFLFSPILETINNNELQNIESVTDFVDNGFLQYSKTSLIKNTFTSEQKEKLNLSTKHFLSNFSVRSDDCESISNFNISNSIIPDFLPSSLWYPHYSLTQTYPANNPLHLFIDFSASKHKWDKKSNGKIILNRNKYNSAFIVPQNKEYNKPLNLTRKKVTLTKDANENSKGTHHILKNIKRTYKKLWKSQNCSRNNTTTTNFHETRKTSKVQIISHDTNIINKI